MKLTQHLSLAPGRASSGRPRHRLTVAVATLLGVALLLGGCSSDDDTPAANDAGSDTTAFPVTIAQKEGEVTIDERPERIVALDFASADAAIALGFVPVGMAEVSYVEGGVMEWTKAALGDSKPEIFFTDDGFPFEAIARLDPDVILAVNTFPDIAEHWDELNAIAPVVGHVEAAFVDPWQQGVAQIGKALGRSAEAQQLVADVESSIAEARAAHPEFAAKTVSYFRYLGADGLYVISTNQDFSIKFLTELGFKGVTDTVTTMGAGQRRVLVSPERYADLEADLVIGTASVGLEGMDELARHPVFATLPAIARGAYLPIPVGPSTSMVQPSVLSLPFALDELVPQMATALAGP